jgi:hypothetical protein
VSIRGWTNTESVVESSRTNKGIRVSSGDSKSRSTGP